MSKFKQNPKLHKTLDIALNRFSETYAQLARDVIEQPRLWDDWETSNPFRDIIDTNTLNESMTLLKVSNNRYVVKWSTFYVVFVYYGYALADGRRIPPRKWAEIAIYENDLLQIFGQILKALLK